MSAKVIAFINFKGGVGKTASVVNIGATLAKYHGKKVLIVDLDPQCNSSLWLLPPKTWSKHTQGGANSTFQIYEDYIVGTHRFSFDQAVVRGVPPSEEFPLIASLDLLPASVELLRIEDRIHQNKYAQFFEFLYKTLRPHFSQYDYILLDCPPNVYSVTKTALFASHYTVVPFVPDYLSLSGLEILADEVETFYDRVSGFMTGRKRPKIAAFIISHYRTTGNVYDHAINELEITIKNLKASGKIHPKAALLSTYVRHSVHVAESTNEHLPVILHKPDSIGAQDYADLTQNFIQQFEENL